MDETEHSSVEIKQKLWNSSPNADVAHRVEGRSLLRVREEVVVVAVDLAVFIGIPLAVALLALRFGVDSRDGEDWRIHRGMGAH